MSRPRRTWAVVAVLPLAALAAACAPPTGGGTPTTVSLPSPPVISAFQALRARAEAPVTVTYVWNVSDPNGDTLTCRLDEDGDGTVDRTIGDCDNQDTVSATFTGAGFRAPVLEVDDGISVPVTASTSFTVQPAPDEDFAITLDLAGVAPEYRSVFTDAATRWSEVITAGLPDQPLVVPDQFLGWIPGFDGVVDDVRIAARTVDIDGPRGTLGRAGALLTREFGGQAYFGVMEFDTADVVRLAEAGRLRGVVLHEMGHVLGLGSSWITEGLIDDALTDPRYNGAAGVAAWRALGGTGKVPVENTGGLGTALGHWREVTFDTELMTGFSDPDERLSALTIAGLADQGYGVDPGAADPYVLPFPAARAAGDDHDHDAEDHVDHLDPVLPYPDGRLPGT